MEYIIGLWGASWLVNARMLSAAIAARYISGYYGGIMVGRFLTGALATKLDNKKLLRIGCVCAIAGVVLLNMRLHYIELVGLIIIGIGFGPIFPISLDATKTRFNPAYSADIIGFQMGFAYIGAFVFQTSFGYIATSTSWQIFSWLLLLMMALLIFFIEIVNNKTQKKLTL